MLSFRALLMTSTVLHILWSHLTQLNEYVNTRHLKDDVSQKSCLIFVNLLYWPSLSRLWCSHLPRIVQPGSNQLWSCNNWTYETAHMWSEGFLASVFLEMRILHLLTFLGPFYWKYLLMGLNGFKAAQCFPQQSHKGTVCYLIIDNNYYYYNNFHYNNLIYIAPFIQNVHLKVL